MKIFFATLGVAAVFLWLPLTSHGSPSDCMNAATDGTVRCTNPLITPQVYVGCVQNALNTSDAEEAKCSAQVNITGPILSEGLLKNWINCLPHMANSNVPVGSVSTLGWVGPGQTLNDPVQCGNWTSSFRYGVEMHGWAVVNGGDLNYGHNVAAKRDRTADCPHGLDAVRELDGTLKYCIKPTCPTCEKVGNPLSIATAEKNVYELDYATTGASSLRFQRSYSNQGYYRPIDSPEVRAAGFGDLWRHTYSARVFAETGPGLMASALRPNATEKHFRPDGREALNVDGGGDRISAVSGGWLYRTSGGNLESYDSVGRLLSLTSSRGYRQTMAYSDVSTPSSVAPTPGLLIGVADSFGRTLGFSYNELSQMSSMTDAAGGTYLFAFDSYQNLTRVDYPDGTYRRFTYNESLNWASGGGYTSITGIFDENQTRFASYLYRDGYWLGPDSTEHAGGAQKYMRYPNGGNSQGAVVSIIGPTGATTNYTVADVGGVQRVVGVNQPAGSGVGASSTSRSFDAIGNLIEDTDFNGIRSCYASDIARNLQTVAISGLSLSDNCASLLVSGATLPAGARKSSTLWHPDWRFATRLAEPGRITTSIYNGQPDPFNGNALASCAPSTALLPDGKPIAVLCKVAVQATNDVDGHLGFGATLQAGTTARVSAWTYNEFGQMLTARSPRTDLNRTVTSTYYTDMTADHMVGDLWTITNGLGKVTTFTKYDRHGAVLESIDPNGIVTVNTYDVRRRLTSTNVGGESTTYEHDPAGQLKTITRPDGSWLGYEYDDAHRAKAVKDGLGNRIDYTLDSLGNRTAEDVKDPSGVLRRSLSRVADALGREQQTTGRE